MLLTIIVLSGVTLCLSAQNAYPPPNPPKGKSIQWMGHSFHWFLPTPVAKLATEAGIRGHTNLGVDRIGASTPCQHWNKNPNPVKQMLASGKADVLTVATQQQVRGSENDSTNIGSL
jgi:hypothetical protein